MMGNKRKTSEYCCPICNRRDPHSHNNKRAESRADRRKAKMEIWKLVA